MIEIDYKELNEKIENKDSYKQELRSFASKFNETKRKLNLCSNKIKIKEIKSKYDSFPAEKRYTDYTGIDKDYFVNIKQYNYRNKTYNKSKLCIDKQK